MAALLSNRAIEATLYLQSVFTVFTTTVLTVAELWRQTGSAVCHLAFCHCSLLAAIGWVPGVAEKEQWPQPVWLQPSSGILWLCVEELLLQPKGLSGRVEHIMRLPTLRSSLYHISLGFDQLYAFSQNKKNKDGHLECVSHPETERFLKVLVSFFFFFSWTPLKHWEGHCPLLIRSY